MRLLRCFKRNEMSRYLILLLLQSFISTICSFSLQRPTHRLVPTSSLWNRVVSHYPNYITPWNVCLENQRLYSHFDQNSDDDTDNLVATTSTTSDSVLVEQSIHELYASSQIVPEWLVQKCQECGWKNPTKIQQAAWETIFLSSSTTIPNSAPASPLSVLVQAETGSGKTLLYLLPLLSRIDPSRSTVQAVVVVPTRELGLQVATVAKRLAAGYNVQNANDTSHINTNNRILIMNVLQGSNHARQRAWAWAEPPHVVIGTPEELNRMIVSGGIPRYHSIRTLVVDEVDACLNAAISNQWKESSSTNKQNANAVSALHQLLAIHLNPTYNDGSMDGESNTSLLLSANSNDYKKGKRQKASTDRLTIFCSATIPQYRHFLKQCKSNQWTLTEPIHICLRGRTRINTDNDNAVDEDDSNNDTDDDVVRVGGGGEHLLPLSLKHGYVVTESEATKLSTLRRLLKKIAKASTTSSKMPKVLVFCQPGRPMQEMASIIANDAADGMVWNERSTPEQAEGKSAIISVLKYEDSLSQRAAAMDIFRQSGRDEVDNELHDNRSAHQHHLRVMFSTDLAARGLDIADLSHVIHLDLPPDVDTYVHRSGRTGRMGRPGTVVSISTARQEFVLERMANKLTIDMQCISRQSSKKS